MMTLRDDGSIDHDCYRAEAMSFDTPATRKASTVSPPRDRRARAASTPAEVLSRHPIFGQIPQKAIGQFAAYATRRRVVRGTTIFSKGDPGNSLMAVLDGCVRISVPTAGGHEVVLTILQPGEIFGEMGLLDSQPRSADATAVYDSELMVIDRRDFVPFMRSQPDVPIQLIAVLCGRLRRTNEQVEDAMFVSLAVRPAKALLRFAQIDAENIRPVEVPITQRELGEMIGFSRENTNKQLRAWEKRQWVKLARGSIRIVDSVALLRLSENGADDE
jgi:CRP/FNR family transcriptional regulator, cyclic AMP receptor protein